MSEAHTKKTLLAGIAATQLASNRVEARLAIIRAKADKTTNDLIIQLATHSQGTRAASQLKSTFEIQVASSLHALWQQTRKLLENGLREPRLKEVDGVMFDIANITFLQLPPALQRSNVISAHTACQVRL